jgi:anti-sigma B factor antagonist
MALTITEHQVGPIAVLSLSGKLTSDHAGQLKGKVSSLIADGRTQIVLDLSGLTYMDSSGLGEMVSCHTTATGKGAVKLANLGKRIQDLLVMTKLTMVFDAFDSEQEAIASFKPSA